MWDVTEPASFNTAVEWCEEVHNNHPEILICIVGNKIDCLTGTEPTKPSERKLVVATKGMLFRVSAVGLVSNHIIRVVS